MLRAPAALSVFRISLVCIIAASGACRPQRQPSEILDGVPGPAKESWNVHMHITEADLEDDHSLPRLELIAEYGAWFEERDSTYQRLSGVDEQVKVILYDSTGVVSADITADRVWYYNQTQRLVADGRVFVESSSGRMLATEWVEWIEETRTIWTNRYVQITSDQENLEGRGLTAAEDLSHYQIGPFTAEVTVDI